MKFNINDQVKVRLTDKGREEILRRRYDEYVSSFPNYQDEIRLPKEDKDGWSTW